MIEGPEFLVVALVVLLLFGSAKIPQIARSLGQAKAEFENGLKASETTADPDDEPDR